MATSTRQPDWLSWPWPKLVEQARVPTRVVADVPTLYRQLADDMLAELTANNAAGRPTRWILPVGPIGQYPRFVEEVNRRRLDLSGLHTFQMDEYLDWTCRPIPLDDPLSFTAHLTAALFERLDRALRPPPEQHHVPDPRRLDAVAEAVEAVGGIDTCYGGIGIHGHLAFNEAPATRYADISPDELKQGPTRIVALQPETLVVNGIQAAAGNFEAIPPFAVTLGMREILSARRIRLYCNRGQWQRTIFRRAVMQEPTVRYPVTFVQGHPDALVTADEATAEPPASGVV
ncbi:MAG: glucosamine-6-phosphate isomerase [Armatimonadetes bacterium]|nr:glucosamine-6-phosphate isomerase [Armatimonadota bacterium]